MEDQCVITRTIRVAAGVFAPGHLGELTRFVPFEMVDEALAATGSGSRRVRLLPARVVVYVLLAGCLFAELGYRQVWHKLTAGLAGLPLPDPSSNVLWQARVRLGVGPLRWLFDLLRGAAVTAAGSVRWCGLLVCAIDGTVLTVPDGARSLTGYTKQAGNHGGTGYPLLRMVALVACGTRSVVDAVFGPTSTGENGYARRLSRSLHSGMIVLLDRGFDDAKLIAHLAATQAHLLVRLQSRRRLPVLRHYPDGSFLSQIGDTRVRVVQCEITIATTAGRHTGCYRLATTLLDHRRYPTSALVTLYHRRWEIETAYLDVVEIELRQKLAPRSAADVITVLSVVLQEAVEDRRIPFNPCRGVRVNTGGRPERPHASTEQVAAIAAWMRRPVDELMVITAAYTGMRWGELSGLDRDNVNLQKGTIYVHPEVGALHEVGGKLYLGPPKTADSVRTVDLPPFLTARLRDRAGWARSPDGVPRRPRRLPTPVQLQPPRLDSRRRRRSRPGHPADPGRDALSRPTPHPQDLADRRRHPRDRPGPAAGPPPRRRAWHLQPRHPRHATAPHRRPPTAVGSHPTKPAHRRPPRPVDR